MIDWVSAKQRLRDSEAAANKARGADPERLAAVCRQRAARLAARKPAAAATATIPLLVFTLEPERYGIELRVVPRVMPFADCTPVPGAPPALLGVINLHGSICSVVDLARLLNLPDGDRPAGHIMLVRHDAHVIGFKVDRLEKIERIVGQSPRGACRDGACRDGGRLSAAYVQGVTAEGVIVLDVAQLLSQPIFANVSHKRERESPC